MTRVVIFSTCVATLIAPLLIACTAAHDAATPPPRPDAPRDWIGVASAAGDVRLVLPPYLGVATVEPLIHANLLPNPNGVIPLGLIAGGPQTTQRPGPGVSLEQWIEAVLLSGVPADRRTDIANETVSLPAGVALRLRTVVDAGGPSATAVIVWAVALPDAVGFLQVSGTPDAVAQHERDLEMIAQLMEFARGADPLGHPPRAPTQPPDAEP